MALPNNDVGAAVSGSFRSRVCLTALIRASTPCESSSVKSSGPCAEHILRPAGSPFPHRRVRTKEAAVPTWTRSSTLPVVGPPWVRTPLVPGSLAILLMPGPRQVLTPEYASPCPGEKLAVPKTGPA